MDEEAMEMEPDRDISSGFGEKGGLSVDIFTFASFECLFLDADEDDNLFLELQTFNRALLPPDILFLLCTETGLCKLLFMSSSPA